MYMYVGKFFLKYIWYICNFPKWKTISYKVIIYFFHHIKNNKIGTHMWMCTNIAIKLKDYQRFSYLAVCQNKRINKALPHAFKLHVF